MRPEIIFWFHFLPFPLPILKALVFLHINEAIINKIGIMLLGKKEKPNSYRNKRNQRTGRLLYMSKLKADKKDFDKQVSL